MKRIVACAALTLAAVGTQGASAQDTPVAPQCTGSCGPEIVQQLIALNAAVRSQKRAGLFVPGLNIEPIGPGDASTAGDRAAVRYCSTYFNYPLGRAIGFANGRITSIVCYD
jgi:hypothetical protein